MHHTQRAESTAAAQIPQKVCLLLLVTVLINSMTLTYDNPVSQHPQIVRIHHAVFGEVLAKANCASFIPCCETRQLLSRDEVTFREFN